MRFMILIKADKNTEAGALPDGKLLTEMGKFNEESVKAGVFEASDFGSEFTPELREQEERLREQILQGGQKEYAK